MRCAMPCAVRCQATRAAADERARCVRLEQEVAQERAQLQEARQQQRVPNPNPNSNPNPNPNPNPNLCGQPEGGLRCGHLAEQLTWSRVGLGGGGSGVGVRG